MTGMLDSGEPRGSRSSDGRRSAVWLPRTRHSPSGREAGRDPAGVRAAGLGRRHRYNYGDFIADCLRSVRAQTYERFECIVVDDCSSDDTPAVVTARCSHEMAGRAVPLRSGCRRTSASSAPRWRASARAAGEFVVFLDADDLLFPRFIERHLFVHHNIETAVGVHQLEPVDHRPGWPGAVEVTTPIWSAASTCPRASIWK